MEIIRCYLTKNPCFIGGRKIAVKGIMLHSVCYEQPSALPFIINWNHIDYDESCVHCFIDANDGTAYQTLPWDHRGWHCGSGINGSANDTHIGIEVCEPKKGMTPDGREAAKNAVKRTYESAVELCAMLCAYFSLDPLTDGVIISHNEGYELGLASDHNDPESTWTSYGADFTMDMLRQDVADRMSGKRN